MHLFPTTGLGLASAGWQATRTSLAKVSEATSKAVQATVAGAADDAQRLEVHTQTHTRTLTHTYTHIYKYPACTDIRNS